MPMLDTQQRSPWYQRGAVWFSRFVGVLPLVGAFADAVKATNFISETVTYAGTVVLLVGVFLADFALRRFPLRWVLAGRTIRITRLGARGSADVRIARRTVAPACCGASTAP